MTAPDPDIFPKDDRVRALARAEPAAAPLPALPAEPMPGWEEDGDGPAPSGPSLERYFAAIRRYKWLILLLTLVGGVGGGYAARFVKPLYQVQAIVSMTQVARAETRQVDPRSIRTNTLDQLLSYRVVDPVVTELRLYVRPTAAPDSVLFRDFNVAPMVRAGTYTLAIAGSRYQLSRGEGAAPVESGAIGDSIGRSAGFLWQPAAAQLAGRSTIEFTVRTPREVSVSIQRRMTPRLGEGSSLLLMTYEDADPQLAATTLNAWAESFVAVTSEIARGQTKKRADILEGQLDFARAELASAERALEDFRVSTATLPSESRIPQLVGTQLTQDPVFTSYSAQQVEAQSLRRDREAILQALTAGENGGPSAEGLYAVPTVATDASATELRQHLDESLRREVRLRDLRQRYTEEWREVVLEREALEKLRSVDIPRAARGLMAQIEAQLGTLSTELAAKEQDLREIPQRTIELGRLERKFQVEDERYRSLLQAAQRARLDEMTVPDEFTIYDRAIAPLRPTRDQKPIIIAGAIAAGLGLGIVLAILLDMLDKRFRYPQQATDELGLFILGVIPQVRRARRARDEEQAQMMEAFRAVRMNLRYAVDPSQPFAVTITSPGPTDGKSFVSANLALSFADAGLRVLLLDGDVRRGTQHDTFGVPQSPGLVDYLDGDALLPEVFRETSHGNLTLLPCGRRNRRAPELLSGPRLTQLLGQLRLDYDVIIVDSPPLGAGSDAYALGIATGHLAMVLRGGVSDRKLGAAKLRVVETLPIRVLGAVLNGIEMAGMYKYYDYYLDYAAKDEPVRALPKAGAGGRGASVAVVEEP
jgi:capsular exopolysaccharide synthesis family protein